MEKPTFSPVSHLIAVYRYFERLDSTREDMGFDDDYYGDLNYYRSIYWAGGGATRSWLWQTCNEFGYYQSTNFEKNVFGVKVGPE